MASSVITARQLIYIGPFLVPGSTLMFSLLTFPVTDIAAEIWGAKAGRMLVYYGLLSQYAFTAVIYLVSLFPVGGANNVALAELIAMGWRIAAASLVAYLAAQLLDVWLFCRIRELTGGRWLWLRNNVSTMTAQAVNSALFVVVAYGAAEGRYLDIVGGMVGLKIVIAALDTSIVYLGVSLSRRYLNGDGRKTAP